MKILAECFDSNGYLISSEIETFLKRTRKWHIAGICPCCNCWHLGIVRCKDAKKYIKICEKLNKNE